MRRKLWEFFIIYWSATKFWRIMVLFTETSNLIISCFKMTLKKHSFSPKSLISAIAKWKPSSQGPKCFIMLDLLDICHRKPILTIFTPKKAIFGVSESYFTKWWQGLHSTKAEISYKLSISLGIEAFQFLWIWAIQQNLSYNKCWS